METWQAILTAVVIPAIGGVWAAIRWYLGFREKAQDKQRLHEKEIEQEKRGLALEILTRFQKLDEQRDTMEEKFLSTLQAMEQRCHENEAEQRDLRLSDQKRHIDMLHEVAMRVRPSGQMQAVKPPGQKTPSDPAKPPSSK